MAIIMEDKHDLYCIFLYVNLTQVPLQNHFTFYQESLIAVVINWFSDSMHTFWLYQHRVKYGSMSYKLLGMEPWHPVLKMLQYENGWSN